MKYAVQTLETELRLVEEGLRKWGHGYEDISGYEDIRKRQENKVKELKDAIQVLTRC
jgi:hypothetical protein